MTCAHEAGVIKLLWSAGAAPRLYTGSADHAVRLWDARTGAALVKLTGHGDMVLDLAVTPAAPTAPAAAGAGP